MTSAHSGPRAPTVFVAGAIASLAFASYPLGPNAALAAFFAATMVVIAWIDIASFTIPNRIVLPSTAIVLTANIALAPDRGAELALVTVGVGVALLVVNLISSSWLGMGDVKLGMLLGAALGWGAIGALEIAFLALFPVAVLTLVRGGREARKLALPFGPFMAFGALVVLIVPHLAGLGG
jgi:prepilin signal peptidase PulO-like enzyme (type II secretory pathway)